MVSKVRPRPSPMHNRIQGGQGLGLIGNILGSVLSNVFAGKGVRKVNKRRGRK